MCLGWHGESAAGSNWRAGDVGAPFPLGWICKETTLHDKIQDVSTYSEKVWSLSMGKQKTARCV